MEIDKKELEEMLVLYALGELEPDEVQTVEEELKKRPELTAQVNKFRSADGMLSDVFAQSDPAVNLPLTPPKVFPMPENIQSKSTHRLGYRMAVGVAALALVGVVGVLLYPQIASKDVFVAMAPNENTDKPTDPSHQETKTIKQEEPSASPEVPSPSEAQVTPLEDNTGSEDAAPEVTAAAADPAPDSSAPEVGNLNVTPKGLGDPAPEEEIVGRSKNPFPSLMDFKDLSSDPEDNAVYNIPGQKNDEGMAPIAGETPSMKEELLPESDEQELTDNKMNNRFENQNNQTLNTELETTAQDSDAKDADLDSYLSFRKSILEDNQIPDIQSVNVEQWLKYFGGSESENTTENKSDAPDAKDAQFFKAVKQFTNLISSPEPATVKDLEDVLDLLKDSVGDDAKRQEFKTMVEKTLELQKKVLE